MDQDLKNLARQSLISRRSIQGAQTERVQILVLTKAGRRFLEKQKLVPKDRPIYYGLVKPKEVLHDASLYRLFHKAARQIERDGGIVRKVALDYELKKQINRELSRLGADRHNQDKKREIAQTRGIRVVNGRVVVPDLQIEYENAEGHLARINLELATKHYRPGQLQAKAQAGFTLYAATQDSDRLRRVLNDREITAEILSL
jgi:predicted transcriptional regulator